MAACAKFCVGSALDFSETSGSIVPRSITCENTRDGTSFKVKFESSDICGRVISFPKLSVTTDSSNLNVY